MKSCMNCDNLCFDKAIGSSTIVKCGAGKWEWDSIEVDGNQLLCLKHGKDCDCWEFRIESLYIVRNEP